MTIIEPIERLQPLGTDSPSPSVQVSWRPLKPNKSPHMNTEFEWDRIKAASNQQRHGVSFVEAATVFFDPLSLTIGDPLHSVREPRFVITGLSYQRRLLVVIHVDRGDRIRIISARAATRSERKEYESEPK